MELISALFVGLFLGVLSGGGSILVAPSLIYIFQFTPKNAIASSLLIVALMSLIGESL